MFKCSIDTTEVATLDLHGWERSGTDMEISIAGAAAWWILNLIEALQEAHSISHEDQAGDSSAAWFKL